MQLVASSQRREVGPLRPLISSVSSVLGRAEMPRNIPSEEVEIRNESVAISASYSTGSEFESLARGWPSRRP
jgi:hypothetical protein